ncbi:DUF418 domain-containing protein [Carboxylicivirga sp. N1Y90]|uniref:DUF418 domain-containing protein n=1 Tax=Carboxylicivirga fragile TaxID=3417571 RepID=UPI003D34B803|nr:DUF418 domain-containing protein [Marinilabiliaceae bacterium N1Y90]
MGKSRIVVVDALRGFALVGILLLHALEHFDFFWPATYNPAVLSGLDKIIHDVTFFIFAGKSYAIFSVLFGFSFYIQMRNQELKGIDFRGRFAWRLVLLLVLGYLHTLIYMGDILMIYAIMGLPLILFYKVPTRFLVLVAALLLLHVTRLYELVYSFIDTDFTIQRDWGDWTRASNTFGGGTFWEVVKHNTSFAIITKIKWTVASARVYQLFGLFVVGMLLGRTGYFENLESNKRKIWKNFFIGFIGMVLFQFVQKGLVNWITINDTQKSLITELAGIFTNMSMLVMWINGFILLYLRFKKAQIFENLSLYGKMSLTSYVTQPLIGVPLFYGYGFGLYQYLGNTLSFLYAVVFLLLQLMFCKVWFKYYTYGPLEWLWRALTYFNFNLKMKR